MGVIRWLRTSFWMSDRAEAEDLGNASLCPGCVHDELWSQPIGWREPWVPEPGQSTDPASREQAEAGGGTQRSLLPTRGLESARGGSQWGRQALASVSLTEWLRASQISHQHHHHHIGKRAHTTNERAAGARKCRTAHPNQEETPSCCAPSVPCTDKAQRHAHGEGGMLGVPPVTMEQCQRERLDVRAMSPHLAQRPLRMCLCQFFTNNCFFGHFLDSHIPMNFMCTKLNLFFLLLSALGQFNYYAKESRRKKYWLPPAGEVASGREGGRGGTKTSVFMVLFFHFIAGYFVCLGVLGCFWVFFRKI